MSGYVLSDSVVAHDMKRAEERAAATAEKRAASADRSARFAASLEALAAEPRVPCPTCNGTGVETWSGPHAGSCSRCRGFQTVPADAVADAGPGRRLSADRALRFILAGRAFVTLRSTKTGARFTYRVTEKEDAKGVHFVALLTGPENTGDYAFLGTVFEGKRFRHGKRSRVGADAPGARAFAWTFERLAAGRVPETVEIWHSGRCGKCGRLLTDPTSIELGLGPKCRGDS